MTSYILSAVLMLNTIFLPLMSQPLSFGLILLWTTLLCSLLMGYFTSSWYAYMTFIVFVGGLLVMFAYVAALIPNSFFKPLSKSTMLIFLGPLYIFTSFFLAPLSQPTNPALENSYALFSNSSAILYSPSYMMSLLFLTYILLLALISVVKVCSFNSAPLRPYN